MIEIEMYKISPVVMTKMIEYSVSILNIFSIAVRREIIRAND